MSSAAHQDLQRLYRKCLVTFDTFHQKEPWLATEKLFRIAILSWFLLHTALLIPYASSIFGPNYYAVAPSFDPSSPFDWLTNVLNFAPVTPFYPVFITAQLSALICAICGIAVRPMTAFAWLLTLNLNNRAPMILDGGNNLSVILLFYLLFMNTTGTPVVLDRAPRLRALIVSLSNGAFILTRLQIFAVYFTVAIFKLNGQLWQHGMALYYILQSEQYSHPTWGRLFVNHEWLAFFGTYFTVLFQISFPFLVWPKRTRPYLLLAGTSLHIGIASVMGLFTFGLVMCVAYIAMFPDCWSRGVLNWLLPNKRLLGNWLTAAIRPSPTP